jgi:tRNA (cytidine32/uridine32-2'-O)-methyltransferase
MNPLQKVRLVLVETSHPGNIGAAARAMKTMGVERLSLVRPKCFPHAEATVRACGADNVLANAELCKSLREALKGCSLVMATSARRRSIPWPQITPGQCAKEILMTSRHSEVAVVFGREQSGLRNSELDLCHKLVYIPCNPQFSSLNLAAAVQILCYELYAVAANKGMITPTSEGADAAVEIVEQFYDHLEQTLIDLDFLDPSNPKHLMRRLRRLFNRVRLSHNEVSILRGILTAMHKKIQR